MSRIFKNMEKSNGKVHNINMLFPMNQLYLYQSVENQKTTAVIFESKLRGNFIIRHRNIPSAKYKLVVIIIELYLFGI